MTQLKDPSSEGQSYLMLSREAAALLAAEALDATNTPYGISLLDAVRREAPSGSWFESALVAGHVPYFDTIPMVVKACHAWTRAEMDRSAAEDAMGDFIGLATSTAAGYRKIATLLETLASELDDAASQASEPDGGYEAR